MFKIHLTDGQADIRHESENGQECILSAYREYSNIYSDSHIENFDGWLQDIDGKKIDVNSLKSCKFAEVWWNNHMNCLLGTIMYVEDHKDTPPTK